jgi:hypothetical protein
MKYAWYFDIFLVLVVGQAVLDAILGEQTNYRESAQRKESSAHLRQIPHESVQKE